MLAQPKLLSWPAAKSRIINQLQYTSRIDEESPHLSHRISSLTSKVPQFPLFSSRALNKFQFDTCLQAFTYYRSSDEDEDSDNSEDVIIASLFYDDPKDPRSAVFVYFTSLTTGVIRRFLKYDFQFPSFQLLKYISKLKLIVGYSNNRLYLLSNKNGDLKYLTSISCPGVPRRIIYDRTSRSRDILYVGGDKGLFVRWYLVRESNGYDLRLGDRLKSVFINRQHNIIDMKLDPITHKLFIVGHKGCLIFDTLLNRESASVLSAHGAPVTCANIYGFSIIMGFSDGVMKIFEIGSESIPVRYQLQAHRTAMINLLITTDGVIITGADDGSLCFYSLESLIKLGEHRFSESIERIMFVRGEDLLVKFKNDLQLLTYALPIRSFSSALQSIEQLRVTFPVGSIPSRVVVRSSQNLFTVYNPRSSQIINIIPLSPNRITVNDFVYDSAGEILYILTSKTICSYHCASQPSYLINIFEVKDECLFTKLCCIMWFSLLPEHTKKRRAFGVVFVGTTNGKLYLVPGDHGLKYALLPDTPEALYSYFQVLNDTATVDWLEIFQAYETYTTRRSTRYLLAIGNDFIAKFYRLSINDHEIFLRELGIAIHLDAPCIGAAMAEYRIAIACALRGYIRMYAITINGLDEISPKDILQEHSPIKSLTGCDTLGLFATLNSINEIMLWTRNNEAIRKLKCDVPFISIANLNDRGDILLVSSRRLYFLMISDFAPEQVLFDLTKKTIKDDPIELPVQFNKNFDKTLVGSAPTVQLDARGPQQVPTDVEETDTLGFFELLEQEKALAEMAKMLEQKKIYPIAPDGFIPNSTIRSMFKLKEMEPSAVQMFRLRLMPSTTPNTIQSDLDERLKRYSVLTNLDGIHSTIFQSLNKIDILDNLENKTNKNLNWQNDDDEWVELGDPDASVLGTSSKSVITKKPNLRPAAGTSVPRQKEPISDVFKQMKNEPWWKQTDDNANNNPRSMLLYLLEILKAKQSNSYESACNYVVEIFKTYGIEPSLVNQILDILIDHLAKSTNDPLDVHTVRTIGQFMIERKNIIIPLLDFALKYQPDNILRQETINAIKFITDVNSSEDIDLVFDNMSIVRDTADDTFSLKTIIERIKNKQKKPSSDLVNEGEEISDDDIHPLLKKISEERWFSRGDFPITLDSIIDEILAKLPNSSKTLFKTLTTHLVQLHRAIGYSKGQFVRVSNGIIGLLSHADADYRLRAATVLAELGQETKAIDIALLNSFLNDPRILVRTECCDTLKKLTGIMSDTVLKDCAEDIPYLETLPEEGFTLQNYLKEKNRVPTNTTDEQALEPVDENQEETTVGDQEETKVGDQEETKVGDQEEQEKTKVGDHEEQKKTKLGDQEKQRKTKGSDQEERRKTKGGDQEEQGKTKGDDQEEQRKTKGGDQEEQGEGNIPSIDNDKQEKSKINIDDSIYPPPVDKNDDIIVFVRSRSPSPETNERFHLRPNTTASPEPLTPVDPSIQVEINDRRKPILRPSNHDPKSQKELLRPLKTVRSRKSSYIPFKQDNRLPIKVTFSDPSSGGRLLPNNTDMWDSYTKQDGNDEENNSHFPINQEQTTDPIQIIIDDHKHHFGYYRMIPKRTVLVPHIITFGDIFGDQSHITVNRKPSFQLTSNTSNTMKFSDLNRNKRHLDEVESMQLLSSLIIRGIQLHRKRDRFIPGPFSSNTKSSDSFTDALTISQIQLHSLDDTHPTSFSISNKLPLIHQRQRSASEMARMQSDAQAKATKEGINLRKAEDMEDALSNLLKTDREHRRSRLMPTNTSHPPIITTTSDHNEVTHAWVLEQLLKSRGISDPQNYIQQISRVYPKFNPLLHSRVPQDLIPVIWNDPVMQKLASIISTKQLDQSSTEDLSIKPTSKKLLVPTFDDEHSSNFFDYSAPSHLLAMQQEKHRDDHKKKVLPPIHGAKIHLPRHVLKFSFQELDIDPPEASIDALRDESTTRTRRRRIYMRLRMSVNEDTCVRHEMVKNQLRQILKTDY